MLLYEKETIINFNDDSQIASVYTCSETIMRKLDKLCKSQPEYYTLVKSDIYSKTYSVASKKLIKFTAKRIMTDEQKLIVAERFNKNNVRKNNTRKEISQ